MDGAFRGTDREAVEMAHYLVRQFLFFPRPFSLLYYFAPKAFVIILLYHYNIISLYYFASRASGRASRHRHFPPQRSCGTRACLWARRPR